MNAQDLFDAGYALCVYNINNDIRSWKFGDRYIDLPADAVEIHRIDGRATAKWDDVLRASSLGE